MKLSDIVIKERTRKHLGNIQQLADSILSVGLLHPVVINSKNELIAGYRRIKAYELLGLNDIPCRVVDNLDNALSILLAERDENTCRLDFAPSEAVEVGKKIEPLEREAAKIRQSKLNGKTSASEKFSEAEKGNALDKIGQAIGMSRPSYTKAKKVVEFATENPEYEYIIEEMDATGKIDRAAKEMNRIIKLQNRQSQQVEIPSDSPVWHGDFRIVGQKIPDNSVDLIFTDPPYNEDAIELYRDLGKFAARVLKPGGLCLTYSGQIFLPQVLNALGESLEYIWCFSTRHNEAQTRIFKVNVKNTWKPIVAYTKPPLEIWWKSLPDSIIGKMDKSNHKWQQNLEDPLHYLSHLCPPNGLVVDPFCGSGTTLVAAKTLKLNYIGIEDDIEDVNKALQRLNDYNPQRR